MTVNDNLKNKFRLHDKDTGSVEYQVVAMTQKINELIGHFKTHKADYSSRRGLTKLVNRRRKFLDYIKKGNSDLYKKMIEDLNLRK